MTRGKFITFEGGEGAGKSTQAERLWRRLNKLGIETDLTREPGGTPFAEAIRAMLLESNSVQRSSFSELLLFYAARADHLDLRIRPALEARKWVICDRFIDSTRAYQGVHGKSFALAIKRLESVVVGRSAPDLTIMLDVDPEVGIKRAIQRTYEPKRGQSQLFNPEQLAFHFAPDRFEALDIEFHRQVRSTFLQIAQAEPKRCAVVDSAGGIREVADRVWSVVLERLGGSLPQQGSEVSG
jgi:dTMP kinase